MTERCQLLVTRTEPAWAWHGRAPAITIMTGIMIMIVIIMISVTSADSARLGELESSECGGPRAGRPGALSRGDGVTVSARRVGLQLSDLSRGLSEPHSRP